MFLLNQERYKLINLQLSLFGLRSLVIKMDKYYNQKVELAAAFRWTARLDMHESVVNHFSLSVDDDSSKFLVNPGCLHFSLIKASDLILVDINFFRIIANADFIARDLISILVY